MKILVIIVNYGNEENLKKCLKSLEPLGVDACVVENSPQKSGILNLESGISKNVVKKIYNKSNLGFAGGVNLALRYAQGKARYDWFWLLNPDTVIKSKIKNQKSKFWNIFDKGGFDIWSPVVYQPDGQIWFAGGKINRITGECTHEFKVQSAKCKIAKNINGTIEQLSNESDWVSGCSMFIKREVIERIGLFDERFFLFYEDVDFCLRARKAGFKIGILTDLPFRVVHNPSQSVNKLKNKHDIEIQSKMHLLRKHNDYFYPTSRVISWLRSTKHMLNLKFSI